MAAVCFWWDCVGVFFKFGKGDGTFYGWLHGYAGDFFSPLRHGETHGETLSVEGAKKHNCHRLSEISSNLPLELLNFEPLNFYTFGTTIYLLRFYPKPLFYLPAPC